MIFWVFVILTVICIAIIMTTRILRNKYSYRNDNNNSIVRFAYNNDETIYWIIGTIAIIGGIVVTTMLCFIIPAQTSAEGKRANNEQRYEALIYKLQTESIRDEFGIVNKEYIDELQRWNEDVVEYQAYSNNFWIGIFYPKRAFDGFETINLEDIKMRD